MAEYKLTVLVNDVRALFATERALRKRLVPTLYHLKEVRVPPIKRENLEKLVERISRAKEADIFPFDIPGYDSLVHWTLAALESSEEARIAIAIDTGYAKHTTGKGIPSHFEARALLVEVIGQRSWDATKCNLHPFVSSIVMPYVGLCGATEEQVERGVRNAIKNLIEGWKFGSTRYDGVLQKLHIW